ncbi:MAG: hypothetical protein WCD21_30740 [Streptomyces sp.]
MFFDVLMLAVSDLASEDWDFRFAELLTLQARKSCGAVPSASTWRNSTGVRRSGNVAGRGAGALKEADVAREAVEG